MNVNIKILSYKTKIYMEKSNNSTKYLSSSN